MRSIFYGWYLAGAVSLMVMPTAGLGFYTLPILLSAMVREFGLPLEGTSYALSSFFLSSAVFGLIAARLLEKYDVRLVICISATICGLLLVFVGYATTLPRLFAFFILFGSAYSCCSLIPAATLIARWFSRQRARAMMLAQTGLSFGGIFLSPIAAYLIEERGIAEAGPIIGAIFMGFTLIPTLIFIRSHPSSMGMMADGEAMPVTPPRLRGTPYWLVIRSRLFIYVTLAWFIFMIANTGALTHLYNLATIRFDATIAGISLALLSASSMISRVVAGFVMERVSPHASARVLFLIQGTAMIALGYADTLPFYFFAVILFGTTMGTSLLAQTLLLAAAFGERHYGDIYALSSVFFHAGAAMGPGVIAILYVWGGGYDVAYYMAGGILSFSAFGLLMMVKPRMRY